MLNYGKQWLDDDDIAEVTAVLKSDFLTQGPKVREFEEKLADYVDAMYAVAVSNGTAALHLAVRALLEEPGITKYTDGITSPNTFVASSNCLAYNGLKPNFADIDERTYCIDAGEIRKRMTLDTGMIIPVHFAGQPCDMEEIVKLGKHPDTGNPVHIIEDASHAIGSQYANGKRVGSCYYADMTVFSFHPVKTIATGEGGAITTNSKRLYERLLLLRNHGITKDPAKLKNHDPEFTGPWYYEMQVLGFNYRLTDIQAALGVSQLRKTDTFVQRRREIVKAYNHAFGHIDWLTTPYERPGVNSAFHLYVLGIDFKGIGKSRTGVMTELKEKGVGTQVHYIPVHTQPYYRERWGYKRGDFPKAENYYDQCLSIPLYPKMTDGDVEQVIEAVKGLA
ncbi:MAG: UDP-4-amino-4,6-dideoxy-N-acetyl-beta-L-altrosamine transaminase [bacterium]|nr:UDP-4-amino-4,6-dideoxy-N-acetyl-beta-L-altrosamine transaminase [bacterium]